MQTQLVWICAFESMLLASAMDGVASQFEDAEKLIKKIIYLSV